MLFEVRGLLQNAAMRFERVRNAASKYHSTGMNGDPARVASRLEWYTRHTPIEGREILELGPGQTPDVLIAARAAGARRTVAIDIQKYDETTTRTIDGVELHFYDGRALPFEDGAFDVVWSSDVLEHVRHPEITLAESFRVLRPGGLFMARIDLRDHYHLHDEREWFHCLRYTERMWQAMTSNRSAHVNRLRASDWRRVFSDAGFVIEAENPTRSEVLREEFIAGRIPAAERRLGVEDATTWRLDPVLRKPAHD